MTKTNSDIPKESRSKTSISLSESAQVIREWLANELGMNQTAVVELALRELATKWGYYKK
jgi:hypothetical protein